jgi:hypothetical protein
MDERESFQDLEAFDEKEAYRARVWKTRQRKQRDPAKRRKQKQYQRRNRAKRKQDAKRRYKKYKVNPAFKRQRKIQRSQKQRRRRLASENLESLKIKVAMLYLKKKSSKSQRVQVKDLPDAVKNLFKKIRVRPSDVEVRPSASYNLGMASAYGDGYRGFGYVINLVTGEYKAWESPWGMLIPDQKAMPIPVNGAVVIGQQGGTRRGMRVSYLLINPQNMGLILPQEKIDLSKEEEKALAVINEYNSRGRKEEFPRFGLGEYSSNNQYVKRLLQKGLLIKKGRGLRVSTSGKNLAKKVVDFYWEKKLI